MAMTTSHFTQITECDNVLSADVGFTTDLGERIAPNLAWGTVVLLFGELGTGKTVLSRGIARGLGVSEPVTSPSFTVVQEYPLPENHWLYHLDMYRIGDEEDALSFGIDDYLYCHNAVTLIEWPERIEGLLLDTQGQSLVEHQTVPIYIEHMTENTRRISMPRHLVLRMS
ncbi:MAG: tRNA (adenosine(37)-N6)-threonylcarbamoyltransferase complex ATPase subunit type 1 TsaE [Candidatus Pacebacteria bacterium]|nr:tRNA (adenosine(37)-N6)-threonylcarbamoyltransferase complex ATPase subunit type 1 TsaE [Candidatus Paceibacterota bacterium]